MKTSRNNNVYYLDDRHLCSTETRIKMKMYYSTKNTKDEKCVSIPSNYYFLGKTLKILKDKLSENNGKLLRLEVDDKINNVVTTFRKFPTNGLEFEKSLLKDV